uniref:Cordon-bleu ubiquitin-like domain-containing protein n=1 Tax=Sinocyclocheilus grahami TaxID=75366 RepID=A0A672Q130_SINGR
QVSFKPNTLLGALDVSCALIKERVLEDKPDPPKTVRLVVNYHRSQKAMVRVNPLAPLHILVPVICQKCEFDPAHVLLFRDNISHQQLDLDKCLSELDIRELYVLDQKLVDQRKKGLLGFLKFNRRKSKVEHRLTGPCVETRPSTLGQSQSVMNISKMSPKVELKKQRAPSPPTAPTQTLPILQQDNFFMSRKECTSHLCSSICTGYD